jgi:hypothetical protein
LDEYLQFGVTPTDKNMQPLNPNAVDLRDFTMTVTMVNI